MIRRTKKYVANFLTPKSRTIIKLDTNQDINSQQTKWIDNFINSTDQKLAVFTARIKTIEQLEKKYKNISIKIDGSTKTNIRLDLVNKFNNSKGIRLLLGNIKACGVGLNITGASTAVFLEWFKSPGELLEIIQLYLKNEILREKIANQGYSFVIENFTWETIVDKILNIVKKEI